MRKGVSRLGEKANDAALRTHIKLDSKGIDLQGIAQGALTAGMHGGAGAAATNAGLNTTLQLGRRAKNALVRKTSKVTDGLYNESVGISPFLQGKQGLNDVTYAGRFSLEGLGDTLGGLGESATEMLSKVGSYGSIENPRILPVLRHRSEHDRSLTKQASGIPYNTRQHVEVDRDKVRDFMARTRKSAGGLLGAGLGGTAGARFGGKGVPVGILLGSGLGYLAGRAYKPDDAQINAFIRENNLDNHREYDLTAMERSIGGRYGGVTPEGRQRMRKYFAKTAAAVAIKRDPAKWEAAKREAKAKMGGKHSARAMQLAVQIYKKKGGEYAGKKPAPSSNKLRTWTKQKWQWSGGDREGQGGEGVYLPKRSASALKSTRQGRARLAQAVREKREATARGQQFSQHGLHVGKKRSEVR